MKFGIMEPAIDSGKPMSGRPVMEGGAKVPVDGVASDFFLVAMIREGRRWILASSTQFCWAFE
jgi:hypothetical protein